MKLVCGMRVRLSGDSKDMWIKDYNVRVDSIAIVLSEPMPHDKKVFVAIKSIDGDSNVCVYVRRSACKPIDYKGGY